MTLLQFILLMLVVISAWPVGLFIASKTKEELKAGRLLFNIICLASGIGIIASFVFAKDETLLALVATFAFIFLLSLAALKQAGKQKSKI